MLLANAEYVDFEDIANQTPDLDLDEEDEVYEQSAAVEKSNIKDDLTPTPGNNGGRKRPPAI